MSQTRNRNSKDCKERDNLIMRRIYNGSRTIGYTDGRTVLDRDDKLWGYINGPYIYDAYGNVIGYVNNEHMYDIYGRHFGSTRRGYSNGRGDGELGGIATLAALAFLI